MGFQVVFNTVQIGAPPVILLSAGEDAFVACGSVINLLGVVDIPANLPGHAIVWEQLKGTSVVLSSTDTLATSYPFNERTDKVFRLWIDKGLPEQQFKEVTVFHTPLSNVPIAHTQPIVVAGRAAADVVVCDEFSIIPSVPIPQIGQQDRSPCQPDGGAKSVSFSARWTVPTAKPEFIPLFVQSELYYADTGLAVPNSIYLDAAYPPGSVVDHVLLEGNANEEKSYYVETTYVVNPNTIKGSSCIVDGIAEGFPATHLIDDQPIAIMHTMQSSTVVRFTNPSCSAYDVSHQIVLTQPIINTMRYDQTICDGTTTVSSVVLSNPSINITRFDSSGIGN